MGNKKDIMKKIKTALISVSDKSNLKPLLQILKKNKIKLISSGGTFKEIKKLILNVWKSQILLDLMKFLMVV